MNPLNPVVKQETKKNKKNKKLHWYFANIITYPMLKKSNKILNKSYTYWDNLILIEAKNSSEAYKKAMKFGKQYMDKYYNSNNELVIWNFVGIRELVEIYNPLKDGEELAYSEGYCRKLEKIYKMIPPKDELSIFAWKKKHKKTGKKK